MEWVIIALLLVDIALWIGGFARASGEKKGEAYLLKCAVERLQTRADALEEDQQMMDRDQEEHGRALRTLEDEVTDWVHITCAQSLRLSALSEKVASLDEATQAHIEDAAGHWYEEDRNG